MTPQPLPDQPTQQSQSVSGSTSPSRFGYRPRAVLVGALLLLAAGAVVWWQAGTSSSAPVEPPMPSEIADPEIRAAIERLRQPVVDDPHSADAWGHFGIVLAAHEYNREALVCFEEAGKLDSTNARWPYFSGFIALRLDPDRAVAYLRRAKEIGLPLPEQQSILNLRLADALLERNELDEAERLYREELAAWPGDERASLGLGLVAFSRNDDRTAVQYLTAARESPSAKRTATAHLARLARQRGETDTADKLDRVVDTLPNDAPWRDPLVTVIRTAAVDSLQLVRDGTELEQGGRPDLAAQAFLKEYRQWPSCPAATQAGWNLFKSGQEAQGLELLREAESLDPKDSSPQFRLSQVLFTLAEREAKQYHGSDRSKQLYRESIGHAKRATELKPDHALAYLVWGMALMALGEPAEAVVPLRRGVKCRPEVFDLQLLLAKALLESDPRDREAARRHLENARLLKPKDPGVLELSGRLEKK